MIFTSPDVKGAAIEILSNFVKNHLFTKEKNFLKTSAAGQFWWGAKPLKGYQR